MSFPPEDIFSLIPDRARTDQHQTHDAFQGRRLAGAISAQEGNQLSFIHLEADSVEDMTFTIIGMDLIQLQHHRTPK